MGKQIEVNLVDEPQFVDPCLSLTFLVREMTIYFLYLPPRVLVMEGKTFVLESSLHRTAYSDVRCHPLQSHEVFNYLPLQDAQIFWELMRNLSFP